VGVVVLRFSNSDVLGNLNGVAEQVRTTAIEMRKRRTTPTRSASPADLPLSGGGDRPRSQRAPTIGRGGSPSPSPARGGSDDRRSSGEGSSFAAAETTPTRSASPADLPLSGGGEERRSATDKRS
jgi:hypothetical protein